MVAGVAVTLAACGSGAAASSSHTGSTSSTSSKAFATPTSATTPAAPVPAVHTVVVISGYAFHPATLTVRPDTRITFANHDQTAHTATAARSGFDTGTVAAGRSATVTLRRPGAYTYVCQFHPFMHGTIIVRP